MTAQMLPTPFRRPISTSLPLVLTARNDTIPHSGLYIFSGKRTFSSCGKGHRDIVASRGPFLVKGCVNLRVFRSSGTLYASPSALIQRCSSTPQRSAHPPLSGLSCTKMYCSADTVCHKSQHGPHPIDPVFPSFYLSLERRGPANRFGRDLRFSDHSPQVFKGDKNPGDCSEERTSFRQIILCNSSTRAEESC